MVSLDQKVEPNLLLREVKSENFLVALSKCIRRTMSDDPVETCFDVLKGLNSEEAYYSGVIRVGTRNSVRSPEDFQYAALSYRRDNGKPHLKNGKYVYDFFDYCRSKELIYMLYMASTRNKVIDFRNHFTLFDVHTHPLGKHPSFEDLEAINMIRKMEYFGLTRPIGVIAVARPENRGVPLLFYQEKGESPNSERQKRYGKRFMEHCAKGEDNSVRNRALRNSGGFYYNAFYCYYDPESRTFDSLNGLRDFSFSFRYEELLAKARINGLHESVKVGDVVLSHQLNLILTG